ncbi:methylmalonyl Co-A mutase-associated GTPase MeaB [Sphingomonas sp. YL-JM2C]
METFDRRSLARAITAVENGTAEGSALLDAAMGVGNAITIGVTGPPGAGKSTLVDGLAAHWAAAGSLTAVLTVDPSSPFSGGALLGDRIRMDKSEMQDRVYHRSIGSRGRIGGLSAATWDIVALLGSHGFDRVLIETVGAGQSDIDVLTIADCVAVVSVPGLGDMIQAQKGGLMEIGDVYVVNKADRPGADRCRAEIEAVLKTSYTGRPGANSWKPAAATGSRNVLSPGVAAIARRHGDAALDGSNWYPSVTSAIANRSEGLSELVERIEAFVRWSHDSGRAERRRHERVLEHVRMALRTRIAQAASEAEERLRLDQTAREILAGRQCISAVADRLAVEVGMLLHRG